MTLQKPFHSHMNLQKPKVNFLTFFQSNFLHVRSNCILNLALSIFFFWYLKMIVQWVCVMQSVGQLSVVLNLPMYMHGTFMSLINNFTYVQSIMLSFYSHIKNICFFFSLFQTLVVHTTVPFPIKYRLQQLSPSTTYDHAINQERNICLFLQFIQDTCLCNKL